MNRSFCPSPPRRRGSRFAACLKEQRDSRLRGNDGKWLARWSTALLAAPALAAAAAAACAAAPSPAAIEAGERAYQKCYSCHALEAGRNDLTGPTLHAIVGRRVAAEARFDYSPALRRFAEGQPVWTPELIDRFAADPEALVPGTTMAFHGIADTQERAALIAYLKSLQP